MVAPFMSPASGPTIDGGATVSTRWASAATTCARARISIACSNWASACFATGRRSIARGGRPAVSSGTLRTSRSLTCCGATSCPSSTCANSRVPDWIGNFRTLTSPPCLPACSRLLTAVPVGAAVHACQRDLHLRHVFGGLRMLERATAQRRPRLRDGAPGSKGGGSEPDAGNSKAKT